MIHDNKPKENSCVLTFDDGIKDGFTNAFPILQEFGVPGTFFIPTKILADREILNVQKRHLLLAKLGTLKFVEEFNQIADKIFHVTEELPGNLLNDRLTWNLKYVLDNMDKNISQKILQQIFSKYFSDEEFDRTYMNKDELKKMESEGMELGVHGHEHYWMEKLYFADMEKDLKQSVNVFQEIFSHHPLLLSYPFGSYNLFTKRIVKNLGFLGAVTVIQKHNENLNNPFELHRYDCIDAYPRKSKYSI